MNRLRSPLPSFARRHAESLRHGARNESGIATLEFAILLPLLLILIYGVAEYVNAADNRDKVRALARTLADLTSQGDKQNPISSDVMTAITQAAGPVLAPFAASKATIRISAVGVYEKNGAKAPYICSSWPTTSAPDRLAKSASIKIPTNYQRNGARYVIADVSMAYQPLFATVLGRLLKSINVSFTWSDSIDWPVRGGISYGNGRDAEVVLTGGQQCPASL